MFTVYVSYPWFCPFEFTDGETLHLMKAVCLEASPWSHYWKMPSLLSCLKSIFPLTKSLVTSFCFMQYQSYQIVTSYSFHTVQFHPWVFQNNVKGSIFMILLLKKPMQQAHLYKSNPLIPAASLIQNLLQFECNSPLDLSHIKKKLFHWKLIMYFRCDHPMIIFTLIEVKFVMMPCICIHSCEI